MSFQSLFAAADDVPFEDGSTYAGFTLPQVNEAIAALHECYRLRNPEKADEAGAALMGQGYEVVRPHEDDETCHILLDGNEVRIIFTGAAKKDWGTCKKFFGTYVSYCRGRIHRGFASRLEEMWESLFTTVHNHAESLSLTPSDLKYTITGHSMGGALTSLTALRLAKLTFEGDAERAQAQIRSITFGSPRVFDVDGSIEYDELLQDVSLRLVHDKENHIPSLPTMANGSRHVGCGVMLPRPQPNSETLIRPVHILPAYRNAMAQVLDAASPQPMHLMEAESAWISAGWSKLKNLVGTPRWGIMTWRSDDPIERRLSVSGSESGEASQHDEGEADLTITGDDSKEWVVVEDEDKK